MKQPAIYIGKHEYDGAIGITGTFFHVLNTFVPDDTELDTIQIFNSNHIYFPHDTNLEYNAIEANK